VGNRFSSAKHSIAECDRCGFRFKLKILKRLVIKTKQIDMLVCPTCWEPDQPQLQLGMYPVDDPQGVRNPRPDRSYVASGPLADGFLGEGSRIIQWGWNPVGGGYTPIDGGTPNTLVSQTFVGTVTIELDAETPIPPPPVFASNVVEAASGIDVVGALMTAATGVTEPASVGDAIAAGLFRAVTLDPYRKHPNIILSNSNLTATWSVSAVTFGCAYSTVGKNTGKFYFEVTNTTANGDAYGNYILSVGISTERITSNDTSVGGQPGGYGIINQNGSLPPYCSLVANSVVTADLSPNIPQIPQGGYVGVAVDLDAGKMWFNANGTWVLNGDPEAGTNPSHTFTPNAVRYAAIGEGGSSPYGAATANFGATAFAGTKPTGFEVWNAVSGLTNTLDPVYSNANVTLSGGNLTAKSTSTALPLGQFYGALSTISHNTGKYYMEFVQDVYVTKSLEVGLVTNALEMGMPTASYIGSGSGGYGVDVDWAGNLFALNSSTSSTIGVGLTSNGDNIGIAVDFDAGKWWVRRNGVWTNGDPAAGTGGVVAFPIPLNATLYAAVALNGNVAQVTAKLGDSGFTYSIPSGFYPWGTSS
jgi:hypothetical protein